MSRRLGRGGGSVIGGMAMLAVDPSALGHLAAGRPVVLVSGTNGKTTTTSLLAAALGTLGPVASNAQGANLPAGVAAALAGAPPAAPAALEVDEAWLPNVVRRTAPAAIVLLNLSRDQLDRNNEVRTLATSWREALGGLDATLVVANADDPLVAWAAGRSPRVRWVAAGQRWTADAAGCPACGGRIDFAPAGWACASCDLRRPPVEVAVDPDGLVDAAGSRRPLVVGLPGRANRANAAMALCAAVSLGADPDAALAAMAAATEVVGRYRVVPVGAGSARLLLAKNPAGWLEVLDVLSAPPAPAVVAINARIADGRDPSWLWDVPFEELAGRRVVATGERGRDLAVRLRYAGVEHSFEPDAVRAVRMAVDNAGPGAGPVDVVGNYTAFQVLRTALGREVAG